MTACTNYLSRSVPEIHYHIAGTLTNHPTDKQQPSAGTSTPRLPRTKQRKRGMEVIVIMILSVEKVQEEQKQE